MDFLEQASPQVLPAYATPQTPPIQRMPFLPGQADKVSDKLQMLLELDRQVEAAWKAAKLRDDDRRLAADKVISVWDAKMLSYRNVRLDGTPDIGLNVDQVGRSFRRGYTDKARREGCSYLCLGIWQPESHKHCAGVCGVLQGLKWFTCF